MGYVVLMSDAAREMIRAYFGTIGSNSDLRLQKIRELRERDDAARLPRRRVSALSARARSLRGNVRVDLR
jgi:hypothetical protein